MFKTESKGCSGCIYRYDPNLVVITYENLTQFSCNVSVWCATKFTVSATSMQSNWYGKIWSMDFYFSSALCRVRQKSKGGITACIDKKQANVFWISNACSTQKGMFLCNMVGCLLSVLVQAVLMPWPWVWIPGAQSVFLALQVTQSMCLDESLHSPFTFFFCEKGFSMLWKWRSNFQLIIILKETANGEDLTSVHVNIPQGDH